MSTATAPAPTERMRDLRSRFADYSILGEPAVRFVDHHASVPESQLGRLLNSPGYGTEFFVVEPREIAAIAPPAASFETVPGAGDDDDDDSDDTGEFEIDDRDDDDDAEASDSAPAAPAAPAKPAKPATPAKPAKPSRTTKR